MQNEKALFNMDERTLLYMLEKLFEASPEGVVLGTLNGNILRVNNAFCRIFGISDPMDVIGKNIDDVIADEESRVEAVALTEAVCGGKYISIDSVRKKADGSSIDVSILGVPIKIDEDIVGVFAIYRDISDKKAYERTISENLASLSLAWRQTVELLAAVSEMRDPYTAGHQKRVAEIAKYIAMQIGLTPNEVDGVEMAALIHDIGKIRVPAEILSKPGPLDDIEYLLVKVHPRAGYDLLKDINFPWPIADMVLQHHERLDGSGYPQGLKSNDISLESRIVAVADVIEAMASDRPYRKALGIEVALEVIKNHSGKLYDPDVVDVCYALYKEGILSPLLELYK